MLVPLKVVFLKLHRLMICDIVLLGPNAALISPAHAGQFCFMSSYFFHLFVFVSQA